MPNTSKLPSHTCSIIIDNIPFSFEVNGQIFQGKEEVLFKSNNNVISNTEWINDGFSKTLLFNDVDFKKLKKSIKKQILIGLKKANININEASFRLKDYHKYVISKEQHNNVIEHTRNLRINDFDLNFEKLEKHFSNIVKTPLSSFIKELKRSHIQIRISRPNTLDFNPPHRDGYLKYWENILNIWIPIAGCNDKSSLPVVPKSHFIPENNIIRTEAKGAYINGNLYYVPCLLKSTNGNFSMIRPNPKEGEALIFTPYLIHGAAVNQNNDITRIALELRFDKK